MAYTHSTTSYVPKVATFFATLVGVFSLPTVAGAQFQSLINDLPGVVNIGSFPDFINGLFLLTIGAAAILAVIMISIGGFQYMGSDSFSTKSAARERITSAIIGLTIILMAVLILGTINPNLVNLNPFANAPAIPNTQFGGIQPSDAQGAPDPTSSTPGFFGQFGNFFGSIFGIDNATPGTPTNSTLEWICNSNIPCACPNGFTQTSRGTHSTGVPVLECTRNSTSANTPPPSVPQTPQTPQTPQVPQAPPAPQTPIESGQCSGLAVTTVKRCPTQNCVCDPCYENTSGSVVPVVNEFQIVCTLI